ncbi:MAG TPA: sensor histidine kinase [Rhodocyclaceae bacterium]|nr:sensor histidine kinase [Rhodocyclaceae bacterium]
MKKESVADALWRYAPKIAGITGVAVGMLVLLGWVFDISLVHHPRYGNLSIKTNAAICFLLAGAVLWIQSITLKQQSRLWQNTARIFIAVLLFIAGATLYEHLAGADLNIDQMLFREKADAFNTLAPNRMALPTTISFLLLGIALALNAPSAAYNRWRRIFTILAMFPAMTSLLGVVYGLPPQYGIGHVTQMTVRSSLMFFVLAFGILASHPQLSLLSIFRAPGIGSLFARRLILAALLLPPLLGGLTLAGARFGLHEMEFALVITASIHIFVLSLLILSTAKFLQDIDTKRKLSEEVLVMRKQQLKGLYAVLHTIREEERRRFSRELHDELGQMLTALRIDLNWLEGSLASAKTPVLAKLGAMSVLLDQTVDAVRQISEDLRPGMLDSLGLAPAIENYVGKFSIRTGIKCDLHIPEDDFTIGSKISIVIFRLTQEALNNASKHANADRISIRLEHHADKIVLTIQDNGCGLAESGDRKRGGFGILGMRERVAMLNGRFSISNSPGGGVRIEAAIPLQENVDLIHTFLNPTQQ